MVFLALFSGGLLPWSLWEKIGDQHEKEMMSYGKERILCEYFQEKTPWMVSLIGTEASSLHTYVQFWMTSTFSSICGVSISPTKSSFNSSYTQSLLFYQMGLLIFSSLCLLISDINVYFYFSWHLDSSPTFPLLCLPNQLSRQKSTEACSNGVLPNPLCLSAPILT